MKLIGEIVSKVETLGLDDEIRHMLHLKLSVDGQSLEAQGQGILAAVKVEEEVFNTYNVGEEIMFEEVARV